MNQAGAFPRIDVQVVEVGKVRVRPDNVRGTWRPMLWWTATSRTWTPWLPINVVVLSHPSGTVLFDTGQSPASLTDPSYYPPGLLGWVYRRQAQFRVAESLPAVLSTVGVEARHVDTVVLSHLHQDHAGNLGDVGHSRVLVDEAELALLTEKKPEMHGVLVDHLTAPAGDFTPVHHVPLNDPDLMPFTHGHDLYGDGALIALPTPGHTPGSMSLLVRRAEGPPLLLVGDVTYDLGALREGVVPGTGATRVQQHTSLRINQLLDRLPGLRVVAAHDPGAGLEVSRPA